MISIVNQSLADNTFNPQYSDTLDHENNNLIDTSYHNKRPKLPFDDDDDLMFNTPSIDHNNHNHHS